MAGITLAHAEAQLAIWINASTVVAEGQEVWVGNRRVAFADLDSINRQITFWDNQIKRISRGGITVRGGTPV